MSNVASFQNKFIGDQASDLGGETTVYNAFAAAASFAHASAENAATNVANTRVWTNPFSFPVRIYSAKYAPDGALTANNTSYATINLLTDDGAAGTKGISHSIVTTANTSGGGTGNWTQNVAVNFSLSNAANAAVASGASIYFNIVKSDVTGVDVPAGTVHLVLHKL